MNKKKMLPALHSALLCGIVSLILVACTPPPTPTIGPWGYDFTAGHLTDARTSTDESLMEDIPFDISAFMQGWTNSVARTPVYNQPARLNLTLKHYEATHSGTSFSISMDVVLQAQLPSGKIVAQNEESCSAVETRGFELGDFAQQVITQESLTPLTTSARDATMWQKVMTSCVRSLAQSFGTALVSSPASKGLSF